MSSESAGEQSDISFTNALRAENRMFLPFSTYILENAENIVNGALTQGAEWPKTRVPEAHIASWHEFLRYEVKGP